MKRPEEIRFTGYVAYARALEAYCDYLEAQRTEPLEYWNAVEGWVKIDEVRKHFDSVGCGTIYKSAGEGRVPLSLAKAQSNQEPVVFCMHWIDRWGCNHYADPKEPHPVNAMPLYTISLQRTEEKNT